MSPCSPTSLVFYLHFNSICSQPHKQLTSKLVCFGISLSVFNLTLFRWSHNHLFCFLPFELLWWLGRSPPSGAKRLMAQGAISLGQTMCHHVMGVISVQLVLPCILLQLVFTLFNPCALFGLIKPVYRPPVSFCAVFFFLSGHVVSSGWFQLVWFYFIDLFWRPSY